jgi:hypothetical protein
MLSVEGGKEVHHSLHVNMQAASDDDVGHNLQEQAGQQSDYEFLTTYTQMSADRVTAKQREVYYSPRDGLAGSELSFRRL